MPKHAFSNEENALAMRIMQMEGVTLRIIRKVVYLIRKRSGMCIEDGCPREAVVGQSRCEHHRAKNLESVKRCQGGI